MADDEKNECQVSEISSARTIKALNGIFKNCVSNSISNLISSCGKFQDTTLIVFHLILTYSLFVLRVSCTHKPACSPAVVVAEKILMLLFAA